MVAVPGHEVARVATVIDATLALLNQLSADRGADITWTAGTVTWVDDGRDDIIVNLRAGDTIAAEMTIRKGGGVMSGTALTVTIPGTPPRELSPNARYTTGRNGKRRSLHWQDRRRFVAEWRETARMATLAAGRPTFGDGPIMVSVVYVWEKGRRTVDDDSAWAMFKASRDGVADALGVNDRRFRCDAIEQMRDPAGVGFTTVALWQEEVGLASAPAESPSILTADMARQSLDRVSRPSENPGFTLDFDPDDYPLREGGG